MLKLPYMLSPKSSLNAVKSFSEAEVSPINSGKGIVPGLRKPKRCNLKPRVLRKVQAYIKSNKLLQLKKYCYLCRQKLVLCRKLKLE